VPIFSPGLPLSDACIRLKKSLDFLEAPVRVLADDQQLEGLAVLPASLPLGLLLLICP
jgi:hypothetical protein